MTPPIECPITCADVDAARVEHLRGVVGHHVEVVAALRLVGSADPAVVHPDRSVARRERDALEQSPQCDQHRTLG